MDPQTWMMVLIFIVGFTFGVFCPIRPRKKQKVSGTIYVSPSEMDPTKPNLYLQIHSYDDILGGHNGYVMLRVMHEISRENHGI